MATPRDEIMASHFLRLAELNLENLRTNLDYAEKNCAGISKRPKYSEMLFYLARLQVALKDVHSECGSAIADYNREKEKVPLSKDLPT